MLVNDAIGKHLVAPVELYVIHKYVYLKNGEFLNRLLGIPIDLSHARLKWRRKVHWGSWMLNSELDQFLKEVFCLRWPIEDL